MRRLYFWLQVGLDILTIPLAILGGYVLKFKIGWIAYQLGIFHVDTVYARAQIEPYLSVMWIVLLIWVCSLYISGVYQPFRGLMSQIDEIWALVKGISIATLQVMAVTFVYKPFPESRFVILYAWILGVLGMVGSRLLLDGIKKKLFQKGQGLKKAIIVGADTLGQDIAEGFLRVPSFGYYYVGTFSEFMPEYVHFHLKNRFAHLGVCEEVPLYLRNHSIDAVFYTREVQPHDDVAAILSICKEKQIEFYMSGHPHLALPALFSYDTIDGQSFVKVAPIRWSFFQRIAKRMMDLVLSVGGIVFLWPLYLGIAVLIKVVSPHGPVFYMQERVGYRGNLFQMIKFRTMIPDAERSGPQMVHMQEETRYIRFGHFLRKTSLDELPQIWHVLKGEMSVVGPRPERPFFVEKFSQTLPDFPLRHQVKPGLTGWAQINGRSVLTGRPEHKLRYDLYYIKYGSLILDIKILLKTIFVVFKREEAY